jgi:hypothetical protein
MNYPSQTALNPNYPKNHGGEKYPIFGRGQGVDV